MSMVAALYVERDGAYYGLADVDPWDVERDARKYAGPHPVVAHPPCERWGRFYHGSTRKPHQFKKGDDGGCFEAALNAVRRWGGVLEHPADSHAWPHFNLNAPYRGEGWIPADWWGGVTCYVEQGFYGHFSRKPTWLYANISGKLPKLRWGVGEQRLHPIALERYGYEKARRIGVYGDGRRQGQKAHPQRHAARVPRPAYLNCAAVSRTGASRMTNPHPPEPLRGLGRADARKRKEQG